MLKAKSNVNKTSKSLLAKCMATEDIRVEHSKSAETAAFDIKNRCLILPIWKDMSNSMYDMLVAHEVSHALHTPFAEWNKALDGVSNKGAFKQICNVIEDARIERLIKSQYAGIRKDFARAYGELHASDLFELKGKNIADLGLIDRLNLEFKLGLFGLVQVPFSADEQKIVTRMANTQTFADVVKLAKELLEDWENDQDGENQNSQSSEQGDGQDGQEEGSQSQSSDDGDQDDENQNGSSSSDQDGQSDTAQSTDGAGDDAETQSGDGEQDGDQKGSPMNQPNLDDIQGNKDQDGDQDGQSDSDQDGQSDKDGEDTEMSSMSYDDYSNNGTELPSETQSAFDQGLKDLVNTNCDDFTYSTLPTSMNIDNIIFDYKDVMGEFEAYATKQTDRGDYRSESFERNFSEIIETTNKFVTSKKAVVNHMVSQFQMKQSADEDRRTSISKSGVLDTTAMVDYRWSEDIFQSNETVADGKNHGMVFFLDWSGSMGNIIKDTVEQLIILTEFCNKVSIPFEVYAFSDHTDILPNDCYSSWDDESEVATCPQYNTKEGASGQLVPHDFTLINFVSSRMNKKEYKDAIRNLYGITLRCGLCPIKFRLGCTPLNEAIVTACDIIPAFQESTGVQIVNAVFLTDGQGHSMGIRNSYSTSPVLHDPVSKRDYKIETSGWKGETNAYLQVLKDRTGCNLIGIYLNNSNSINSIRYTYFENDDLEGAVKTWKSANYAVASSSKTSYDECYIIKGNIGQDDNAMDNLQDGVSYSYTKLRNAFKKSANSNKTDKIIATKMIEVFASTLV